TVTLNDPGDINAANQTSFSIGGNCSEDARTVAIGGAISSTATCNGGSWSKTMDYSSVADGSVTITVNHSDAAGNTAIEASRTVDKDATIPVCGTVGNDCYSNTAATILGIATTPTGK